MNLIKRQNQIFTNLIDDLFHNQDWNHLSTNIPATNIVEAARLRDEIKSLQNQLQ